MNKYGLSWPQYIVFRILWAYYYAEASVQEFLAEKRLSKKLKGITVDDLLKELHENEDIDLEIIEEILKRNG